MLDFQDLKKKKKQGACHIVALPFTLKSIKAIYIKKYLDAKEELWKLKYVTMEKYKLHKIL